MAWIEAHSNLINHPKNLALAGKMGWSKYESAGRLLAFWFWCLEYAPTGDIRGFNNDQLAASVELNGQSATDCINAMVESSWIDRSEGVFRVHDWPDFVSRYLRDSKFRNRPDLWQKVTEVYAGSIVGPTQEQFKNDSRTVQEKSAVPTYPPTNPLRGGVRFAEAFQKKRGKA